MIKELDIKDIDLINQMEESFPSVFNIRSIQNEINTNGENTITLKASSLSFKSLKFELNYDNTKVEIIEVLVNTLYERKAMTNENGVLNIEVLKLQLKDVQNPMDILFIKYKNSKILGVIPI